MAFECKHHQQSGRDCFFTDFSMDPGCMDHNSSLGEDSYWSVLALSVYSALNPGPMVHFLLEPGKGWIEQVAGHHLPSLLLH
jgi:hypothetical protein